MSLIRNENETTNESITYSWHRIFSVLVTLGSNQCINLQLKFDFQRERNTAMDELTIFQFFGDEKR